MLLLAVCFCVVAPALRRQEAPPDSGAGSSLPPIETIVANMVAQGRWNDESRRSFEELRLFKASNPRFKQQASREVRTNFLAPDSYNSVVVKGGRFQSDSVKESLIRSWQPKKRRNRRRKKMRTTFCRKIICSGG